MQDYAVNCFRTLVKETVSRQGWAIPKPALEYSVQILADYLNRPQWRPEPSYAEQYLTLRSAAAAQRLGDCCWFTRAVFPEMGERRGITASYYVHMGEGCYDRVLMTVNDPSIKIMRDHFEFLAEVAWTAIHSQGGFRSMWD